MFSIIFLKRSQEIARFCLGTTPTLKKKFRSVIKASRNYIFIYTTLKTSTDLSLGKYFLDMMLNEICCYYYARWWFYFVSILHLTVANAVHRWLIIRGSIFYPIFFFNFQNQMQAREQKWNFSGTVPLLTQIQPDKHKLKTAFPDFDIFTTEPKRSLLNFVSKICQCNSISSNGIFLVSLFN